MLHHPGEGESFLSSFAFSAKYFPTMTQIFPNLHLYASIIAESANRNTNTGIVLIDCSKSIQTSRQPEYNKAIPQPSQEPA